MGNYTAKVGTEHKCPVCGKKFFLPYWMLEDYVYMKGKRYLCSYSCYSKTIDEYNSKLKHRKEMVCK